MLRGLAQRVAFDDNPAFGAVGTFTPAQVSMTREWFRMNMRSLSRLLFAGVAGLGLGLVGVTGVGCQTLTGGGGGGNDNGAANQNENDDGGTNQNENDNGAADQNENDNAPVEADGAVLFATSCAVCHGADGTGTAIAGDIVGASAAEITEALNTEPTMSSIDLTDAEIAAITDFLAQ